MPLNLFLHKYAATTLKLDNTTHTSVKTLVSVTTDDDDDDDHEELVDHVDGHEVREEQEGGMVDVKEETSQIGGADTLTLKSSLSKGKKNKEKKKVQWVDMIGKELAEIREFEHSEEDENDSDRGKNCVCVIL